MLVKNCLSTSCERGYWIVGLEGLEREGMRVQLADLQTGQFDATGITHEHGAALVNAEPFAIVELRLELAGPAFVPALDRAVHHMLVNGKAEREDCGTAFVLELRAAALLDAAQLVGPAQVVVAAALERVGGRKHSKLGVRELLRDEPPQFVGDHAMDGSC